ncbi:hypothetical protein TRICI_005689 [Trichomonascus ciferrii]|uniref:Peptidase S54 rhomboid domain-containing protein n=1 Tax=Trichomonascus ciferrii TaxID=44093 RepID=A0A642UQD0_9ASCO|nr:hypothetical protein TRICI_005689 [Trichomonascus ciferrii]
MRVWGATDSAQNVTVPTWTLPFIPLILVGIFIPQSSFLGHVLGLGGGWLLEMGYLNFMFVKSTNVVEWIETKIARVIALIPSQLDYITEVRARDIRSSGSAGLPVVNEPSAFQGPGHQLGQV